MTVLLGDNDGGADANDSVVKSPAGAALTNEEKRRVNYCINRVYALCVSWFVISN